MASLRRGLVASWCRGVLYHEQPLKCFFLVARGGGGCFLVATGGIPLARGVESEAGDPPRRCDTTFKLTTTFV